MIHFAKELDIMVNDLEEIGNLSIEWIDSNIEETCIHFYF